MPKPIQYPIFPCLLIVLVITLAVLLSACIEIGNDEKADQSTAPVSESPPVYTEEPVPSSSVNHGNSPAPATTVTSSGIVVTGADPIPPKDAVVPEYWYLAINDTPLRIPGYYPSREIFRGSYELKNNNVGLLANVTDAPLIIDFHVNPGSSNVNDCFFELTVRDNSTGTIVGEEGYGRLYSVDVDKHLVFRYPGIYHLNLYGNRVTVTLSVKEGVEGDQWLMYTPIPTPAQAAPPEEEEIRG